MRKLEGACVLVTGASKGIGLATALAAARHGARVGLLARNPDVAEEQVRAAGFSFGDQIVPLVADVADEASFAAGVETAVETFGGLDGLVNNAGWHPPPTKVEDTSMSDFERLLRLNLTSTFLGCKLAIPYLRESGGAIVNMSSAVALVGQGAAAAYVATKAGQIGLTKALAVDEAAHGVRVNAVAPAGVRTPLMIEWAADEHDPAAAIAEVDSWHLLGGRMATGDEIGEVCAFLLSSESAFITGQVIVPDGGATLGYRPTPAANSNRGSADE